MLVLLKLNHKTSRFFLIAFYSWLNRENKGSNLFMWERERVIGSEEKGKREGGWGRERQMEVIKEGSYL